MLTDMFSYLHAQTCIKTFIHLSHFKSEKQTELNELNELECSKTPSQMSRYAHYHVFLYLHAQTNINTLIFDPPQNHKKSKKIQFAIFINKSLKNHSAKNICRREFCLVPNERE